MTCSCFQNSCPEASNVTINQTTLEIDGSEALFYNESFTTPGATFTLSHVPYVAASVQVARNGVVLANEVDYYLTGSSITLSTPLVSGDYLDIQYFSIGTVTGGIVPTGTIAAYEGGVAPDGFLLMDGSTSHSKATYDTLWTTYLSAHTDLLVAGSFAGTTFTLMQLTQGMVNSSGDLVTLACMIKT